LKEILLFSLSSFLDIIIHVLISSDVIKLHFQTQYFRVTGRMGILRMLLWWHLAPNMSANISKCLQLF